MSATMPLLLLIGGLAMKGSELLPFQQDLSSLGINSVFFDNLFVGDGPRPTNIAALTIEDQARHQWKLVDELGISPAEKISIFGISMGGMIAAAMAAIHPDRVERLFLSATSANLADNPALSDELYNAWMNTRTPEDLDQAVTIAFGKTTLAERKEIKDEYYRYRLMAENKQSGRDFIYQLNSIRTFSGERHYLAVHEAKIPVVIIAGEEDDLFPKAHTEDMKRLLPNSTTTTLKKTGHMLHLENKKGLCEAILGGSL